MRKGGSLIIKGLFEKGFSEGGLFEREGLIRKKCKETIIHFYLLEKDHKVKTKIIQVDFSGGHEIYEAIGKELEELEIGLLGQYVRVRFGRKPTFFVCS